MRADCGSRGNGVEPASRPARTAPVSDRVRGSGADADRAGGNGPGACQCARRADTAPGCGGDRANDWASGCRELARHPRARGCGRLDHRALVLRLQHRQAGQTRTQIAARGPRAAARECRRDNGRFPHARACPDRGRRLRIRSCRRAHGAGLATPHHPVAGSYDRPADGRPAPRGARARARARPAARLRDEPLQIAADALLFHHPAARWLSRRIRVEREYCCDDEAMAVARDPNMYARALAALEESRTESRLAVAAASGTLLDRIQRIAGVPRPTLTPLRGSIALVGSAISPPSSSGSLQPCRRRFRSTSSSECALRHQRRRSAGPERDSLPRKRPAAR